MIENLIRISVANLIFFFFMSMTVFADVRVLVIPKGTKTTFWQKVHEGAQQAGKDLEVRVIFRGPYTEDQHTAQNEIIVGFDFNRTIRDAILSHEMDATIAQNPFQIGYLGVKTAYQLTQNEAVPQRINTDTILINAKNYQNPEVQIIIDSNLTRND